MKKMIMLFMGLLAIQALESGQAFAAQAQLTCHVGEVTHPNEISQDYDLTASLTGDNGRINMPQAKVLDLGFGIETFTSQDLDPGQRIILISVSKKNDAGTTAVGAGSVMTFFDTTEGSLSIQCSVQ